MATTGNFEQKSFYLDVLSNSSLKYFPSNTLTNFKIFLPKPIALQGYWECGLAQIVYPNNLKLFNKGKVLVSTYPETTDQKVLGDLQSNTFPYTAEAINQIIAPKPETPVEGKNYKSKSLNKKFNSKKIFTWDISLPENKAYSSAEEFVELMNNIFLKPEKNELGNLLWNRVDQTKDENDEERSPVKFEIRKTSFRVKIRDKDFSIALEPSVARILGWGATDEQWIHFERPGDYIFPIQKPDLEASKPRFFNVYLDILEPIFIGEFQAPNIKTVSIPLKQSSSMNEVVDISYNFINYIPLARNSFQTIEVQLRDGAGNHLRFQQGLVYLRLHFRKIEN